MKHNLENPGGPGDGLRLKPLRFEFTPPTTTRDSGAANVKEWHPITVSRHSLKTDHWRVACRFLFLCLFFTGVWVRGGPIAIGYTNCAAVTNYPQSLMEQIGQLKFYFAHASVGENMMDGIAALHATNGNYYRLQAVSAATAPPPGSDAGVIYEYDRGNPGWSQKFTLFQSCVSNGWRYPLVNIAMNKLCFIDTDADLARTLAYMAPLEAASPQTLFVYFTIPVVTYGAEDGYNRQVYNEGLRGWCRTNNRALFDIADMESHDPNGNPVTFTYNGKVCQELYSGYATDEGHLNPAASLMVARGFYALAAALMSADSDGDGISDGQELIAGTRPLDGNSVFKFVSPTAAAPGTVVLQWNSSSNRFYTLQRGTAIFAPASFINLLSDAPATPPINTYTDTPPNTGESFYYRVSVRQ